MTEEPQHEPDASPDDDEPQNSIPLSTKGKTGVLTMSGDSEPMQARSAASGFKPIEEGWRLKFSIVSAEVEFPVDSSILVGRTGSDSDADDISLDLTPYGAYQYGVSRRHAQITLLNGALYIEDLNSTNGTRINGFQLTPRQRYLLRDGDEIEFARLAVNLSLEEPG